VSDINFIFLISKLGRNTCVLSMSSNWEDQKNECENVLKSNSLSISCIPSAILEN
jgi:hypothetical protein